MSWHYLYSFDLRIYCHIMIFWRKKSEKTVKPLIHCKFNRISTLNKNGHNSQKKCETFAMLTGLRMKCNRCSIVLRKKFDFTFIFIDFFFSINSSFSLCFLNLNSCMNIREHIIYMMPCGEYKSHLFRLPFALLLCFL